MSDSDILDVDVSGSSNSHYDFLDVLNISKDVKRRLSRYLNSLKTGSSAVYVSPLGDNADPDSLLLEWDAIYQSKIFKVNDSLNKLELLNRSKFGPRSISKPWSIRKQALLEYFDDDRPFTFIPLNKFPSSGTLRPLSYLKAIGHLKNDTNSGLPYFVRKGSLKDKISKMTLSEFRKKVDDIQPCILFTRTQEGDKTRDVWGYPIFVTLFEMMYYIPLLSLQKQLSWRQAINGPDKVDRSISELIYKCVNNDDLTLVSIDFKAFDKSVLTGISAYAFDYIKSKFQADCHSDIDMIATIFHNISIVTPDGILSGRHGVPSGSTFTNEVDSLVQYLVAKSSGCVDDANMQVQGDDGVYLLRKSDVEKFINTFGNAGLTVNIDKSYRSRDYCVYLQNLYHRDYVNDSGIIGGIYPTYRALCRIIYQERFVDFLDSNLSGQDYYSIRTICILENCKNHPLFEEFVRFILSKDKYLLAFSKRALVNYNNLVNQGSGTGGFLYNQYGDDLSGLYSFKTMQIINKIA